MSHRLSQAAMPDPNDVVIQVEGPPSTATSRCATPHLDVVWPCGDHVSCTLYFWWSYSGPYRLIADLQSSLWGIDFITLSILLSWALLYAPLHFLVARIERRFGIQREPLGWKRLVAFANFLFEEKPGKLIGVGLVLFGIGGWLWINAATAGQLTTLSFAEAEQGKRPASRYVRLTDAKILTQNKLTFQRNGSAEYYFPLTSKQGRPAQYRVFARLYEADIANPPDEIVGELTYDGLPGPLRAHVADKGFLAADYFVIHHRADPASRGSFAALMAGVGAAMIVVGWLWARARSSPKTV